MYFVGFQDCLGYSITNGINKSKDDQRPEPKISDILYYICYISQTPFVNNIVF